MQNATLVQPTIATGGLPWMKYDFLASEMCSCQIIPARGNMFLKIYYGTDKISSKHRYYILISGNKNPDQFLQV